MRRVFTLGAVFIAVSVGCHAALQQTEAPLPDNPPAESGVPPAPSADVPVIPAPTPVVVPLNEQRIMKVIPDYATVEDSSKPVAPMTAAQKWGLAWKESIDPYNIATAAMTAGFSQMHNQTPAYGEGWLNYGRRFGAAIADFGTQNLFSAGLFATVLHQDPRYFRKGPASGIFSRAAYSVSRVVVCRNDSGKAVLNSSNLLGTAFGIAVSNVYYPSASRTGTVMAGRIETSLFGGVVGNLMSEFWPDIQRKFFQKKAKK